MPRGAVYAVRTKVAPEHEEEWNRWHRDVHVPEVLAEKGFRRARRLRILEGEEGPRYWTLYDLDSPAALRAYRESPGALRLGTQHDLGFGKVTELQRTSLEVLDEIGSPSLPSEASVVESGVHVHLRPARESDGPALLALLQGTFEGSPPAGFTPESAQDALRALLEDPQCGVFVAEINGQVVARARATLYPTLRFGWRLHLEDMVVAPEHRGGSVGHRLLAYVERWARKEGAREMGTQVGIHRESTRQFFGKEGFLDASLAFKKRLPPAPPP